MVRLSAVNIAAVCYGGWIILSLFIEVGAALRGHKLLGRAIPVQDPAVVALYTHLVRSMGCPRPPRLVQSDEVASPFILASPFRGTTIILPDALAECGDVAALRAVLAHELAHARVGDPWVQRLISLLRCIMPLTWVCSLMAMRVFWEDAAEETGDLRAIRGSGLSQGQYATALKDLALGPAPVMGLGFARLDELPSGPRKLLARLVGRLRALKLAPNWRERPALAPCLRGRTGRNAVPAGRLFPVKPARRRPPHDGGPGQRTECRCAAVARGVPLDGEEASRRPRVEEAGGPCAKERREASQARQAGRARGEHLRS